MKRTYKLAAVVYVVLCLGGISRGEVFHRIPEADRAILSRVATEYKLTTEERKLLFAIRLAENGPAGVEMGVLIPAAQRYKGNHAKSLELQARYAAGTIDKRYTGDLEAFSKIWCPVGAPNDKHNKNVNWLPNVRRFMSGR